MKMTKQIVKKNLPYFFEIQKLFWRKKMCATRLTIALVLRGGKDVDVRSDVNLKLCDHQKLYLLVETCSLTPERLLGMCNGPLSKLSTKLYYKITWNYLQDFYNIVSRYILLNVCIVIRKNKNGGKNHFLIFVKLIIISRKKNINKSKKLILRKKFFKSSKKFFFLRPLCASLL